MENAAIKEALKYLLDLLLLYCSLCIIMVSEFKINEMKIIQSLIFVVLVTYYFYPTTSRKITRVLILGTIAQLLITDISKLNIDSNINISISRVIIELVVFVVLCAVFKAISDFSIVIKLMFYTLIAIMTYLFIFHLGSYNCIDMSTYPLYQNCVKNFQNYETLKNSTLNIFVIAISIFEALSNGIELYRKARDNKRNREKFEDKLNDTPL